MSWPARLTMPAVFAGMSLVIFALYWPVTFDVPRSDFVTFLSMVQGLGWDAESMKKVITTEFFGDARFQPLAFLLLYAQWKAFGAHVAAYHVLNELLHVANAFMLYRILFRIHGEQIFALLVAFAFLLAAGLLTSGSRLTAQSDFSPALIDRRADACVDFYQFACGGWLERTSLPPDRARYGRMQELADRNEQIIREILEDAARRRPGRTPAEQRIGDADQLACDTEPVRRFEVERDRAPVAQVELVFGRQARAVFALLRPIDADDVRPHIGEQHAAERHRSHRGELDHP